MLANSKKILCVGQIVSAMPKAILYVPSPFIEQSGSMKKIYLLVTFFTYLSLTNLAKGQAGYVLLNEYMPWTTNTCSVNGEFIEMYNFGPGPMDIGCYIISDGDFSITIPPNTILNAGEFFVLG